MCDLKTIPQCGSIWIPSYFIKPALCVLNAHLLLWITGIVWLGLPLCWCQLAWSEAVTHDTTAVSTCFCLAVSTYIIYFFDLQSNYSSEYNLLFWSRVELFKWAYQITHASHFYENTYFAIVKIKKSIFVISHLWQCSNFIKLVTVKDTSLIELEYLFHLIHMIARQ